MYEGEQATKLFTQEKEAAEREISQALEKLHAAMTKSVDSKIAELADTIQDQMNTNQLDNQQMMQDQSAYLDSNPKKLFGAIQHCVSTNNKQSMEI
eukprot:11749372-Ditylum_brightwellii.AAC.1